MSGSTLRISSDSTLVMPAVGVLLQQRIEHGAGFVAVLAEDVALLHLLGALLARERRLVEGDVADEVEGVVVAPDLLGEFVEEDALGGEFVEDGLLASRRRSRR